MGKTDEESERLYRRGRVWWCWFNVDERNDQGRLVKRRVCQSTGCRSKIEARKELARIEGEARDPLATARRSTTLGDAINLLVGDRSSKVAADGAARTKAHRSADTVAFYEKCARNWYLYAGRRLAEVEDDTRDETLTKERREELREIGKTLALVDVDEVFVDEFIRYRRQNGAEANTISKDRATLRPALRLAKRARLWAGDLETLFPRGFETGYAPRKRHLTWLQVKALLAAYDDQPHRRAALAFMLITAGEWAVFENARKGDVPKGATLIHARGTKNAWRDRHVPIVARWQRELLKVIVGHTDGEGERLFSPWANARRSIAAACVRAGVPHCSPHSMRHTYAFLMKLEGLSHEEIAPAAGHKGTAMLDAVYGRAEGEELAEIQRRRIAERRAAFRVIRGGQVASAAR